MSTFKKEEEKKKLRGDEIFEGINNKIPTHITFFVGRIVIICFLTLVLVYNLQFTSI